MKYRLPLVTEQAVREAEASRQLLADDFESQVRKQSVDDKSTITCQKGCHDCCYYPMTVSLLEGVSLFRWLVSRDLWRRDLQTKVREAHRRVWGLSPSVWMLSMTPCPLLTEAGLCGAHEARPFVCRTTVSTRDPYHCHPHRFEEGLAGLVSRREVDTTLRELENRLLKNARLTLLRIPIPTAILMGERLCKDGIEPEEVSAELFEEWARNC